MGCILCKYAVSGIWAGLSASGLWQWFSGCASEGQLIERAGWLRTDELPGRALSRIVLSFERPGIPYG